MLLIDEGVVESAFLALELQLEQLFERALLQLAVERRVGHQNARGATVKLANVSQFVLPRLLPRELQKLHSILAVAVGDRRHRRTVVLVLAHRHPDNLPLDGLRIIPTKLQLSFGISRRERKDAGHGAEFKWLRDPPVVPGRLS